MPKMGTGFKFGKGEEGEGKNYKKGGRGSPNSREFVGGGDPTQQNREIFCRQAVFSPLKKSLDPSSNDTAPFFRHLSSGDLKCFASF